MTKKWIIATLLVALSSLFLVGHAAAQTTYTPDSLAAALLTPADINSALSAIGSSDMVTDSVDSSPGSDSLIRVARVYKTSTALISVILFSNADGSGLTSDQRNGVLSAQYLYSLATGLFDPITDFTLVGTVGLGDADQLVFYTGALGGASFNAVSDSFIKGNVFGVVLYATPLDDAAVSLGALAGVQVGKLP